LICVPTRAPLRDFEIPPALPQGLAQKYAVASASIFLAKPKGKTGGDLKAPYAHRRVPENISTKRTIYNATRSHKVMLSVWFLSLSSGKINYGTH